MRACERTLVLGQNFANQRLSMERAPALLAAYSWLEGIEPIDLRSCYIPDWPSIISAWCRRPARKRCAPAGLQEYECLISLARLVLPADPGQKALTRKASAARADHKAAAAVTQQSRTYRSARLRLQQLGSGPEAHNNSRHSSPAVRKRAKAAHQDAPGWHPQPDAAEPPGHEAVHRTSRRLAGLGPQTPTQRNHRQQAASHTVQSHRLHSAASEAAPSTGPAAGGKQPVRRALRFSYRFPAQSPTEGVAPGDLGGPCTPPPRTQRLGGASSQGAGQKLVPQLLPDAAAAAGLGGSAPMHDGTLEGCRLPAAAAGAVKQDEGVGPASQEAASPAEAEGLDPDGNTGELGAGAWLDLRWCRASASRSCLSKSWTRIDLDTLGCCHCSSISYWMPTQSQHCMVT